MTLPGYRSVSVAVVEHAPVPPVPPVPPGFPIAGDVVYRRCAGTTIVVSGRDRVRPANDRFRAGARIDVGGDDTPTIRGPKLGPKPKPPETPPGPFSGRAVESTQQNRARGVRRGDVAGHNDHAG